MPKAKTKTTPPFPRVLIKQVTITSPPPAYRNSFCVRQGLDDAQGWWQHSCVYVNRECCSRSGTFWHFLQHWAGSTDAARYFFQHSLPRLVKDRERPGALKNTSLPPVHRTNILQYSVLRNQQYHEHMISKICDKAQKKGGQ